MTNLFLVVSWFSAIFIMLAVELIINLIKEG